MRPGFIYFKELALGDDNKFTLDFLDQEFAQEIDFLLNNDYYITSLDCKLKVKNHIHDDKKKNEELSEKSQLLLEKGAAYQNNLLLKTYWYVKQMDYTYCFKKLSINIVTNINFSIQQKKKLEIVKLILLICNLLVMELLQFNFEREVIKSKALVVRFF